MVSQSEILVISDQYSETNPMTNHQILEN